jgi:predicted RNase H-like HicB family nuclease
MTGYVAVIHKDEATSYGVSFPGVPGCISAGDTIEEALDNASEALAGHLALLRADGEPVAAPRSIKAIRSDPGLAEDLAGAVLRQIELRRVAATAQH